MARLIYSAIASADGYTEDAAGSFEWAAPGEELFRFLSDLERPPGTYLYGRRMFLPDPGELPDERRRRQIYTGRLARRCESRHRCHGG